MGLYYGIIFMKRILGMLGTSPEPPGIPGIPWARPWDPRGRPWDHWGRPWDPRACSWDPPVTSLRPPGDAPGTAWDFQRPFMDHKNNHISANIQCQKLSIAVFEPACWDPSHEGFSTLPMELHMGSIWRPIWADRRSPSMLMSLHQNKIETAICT